MSVRRTKWTDRETGEEKEAWMVDVKFQHADGHVTRVRKVAPLQTRRGAEQFEHQIREQLLAGTWGKEVELPKAEVTFASFKERFLDFSRAHNKPSTVYAKEWVMRMHLDPAFSSMPLRRIGAAEVDGYTARKLKAGQSKKSIGNHLAVLRKLLNLAVEYGELDRAPRVRAPKAVKPEIVFLDFDEADRFIAAAAPEWKPLLVIALKTGLRLGELLALKWEDLDLKAGRLVVRRTLWHRQEGTPKGGRTREVPLSNEAIATLQAHRHLKGPYVFCDASGKRLSHSNVKKVVPQTCAKAGLGKRLTPHCLRHTFASHLVMSGVNLKTVQELLGHSTIEQTMQYAHLTPEVRREAVQVLDRGTQGQIEGRKQKS
jgi:integrase